MSTLKKLKIGFIGGGNMAQALIGGMLAQGVKPHNIMVSDPSDNIRMTLSELHVQTTVQGSDVIRHADVVILAIKPQLFHAVLPEFSGQFDKQLVISVAAGVSIESIRTLIQHDNIVRAMPNTPALIQTGATGLYAPDSVSDTSRDIATQVLSASGLVLWVASEDHIHAVTATSGSGPAYFFYVMESMISAAIHLGLDEKQAKSLALQTALGAAQMAITSDDAPGVLRKKVTSPNGTTQAALEHMQDNGLDKIIHSAMQAASERSQSLSDELAEQI